MVEEERSRVPRVLVVSLHTSPLERPGTGDAGGLNVYVLQTALGLAARGVAVNIATRAVSAELEGHVERPAPGVQVHHLPAGPPGPLDKSDLPDHLEQFADGLAPLAGRVRSDGGVVHSHYWLSGAAALLAAPDLPLAHTMHTIAAVKNERVAEGERPEPDVRVRGEAEIVRRADLLVANTAEEGEALTRLLDADPVAVRVVEPGVDLQTFRPGPTEQARAELGLPADAVVLLFVGRIQPLKAPDVLLRAAGEMVRRDPALRRRLVVAVLGGPSGSGLARPGALAELAREEEIADLVRTERSLARVDLARWYRAADLLAVPSHHESFGLVALEALASGTPVVAARVGGLPHAVGRAGVLVDGHDPAGWADALTAALDRLRRPGERDRWSADATRHAAGFSWERTVDGLLDGYAAARAGRMRSHER